MSWFRVGAIVSEWRPLMANISRAKHLATRVAMMPRDTNGFGHIYGGVILSNIDIAGATTVRKACGPGVITRCVTRAMDQVEFRQPVYVSDVLTCWGRITRVGKSSISVHVDVEADRNGVIIPVTKADLVFVSVDANDRPIPIPCAPRKPRKRPPVVVPPVEKPIGERVLAVRKTMFPNETNGMGNIFGGILLTYMDIAGEYVARRACANSYIDRCVTRFMDRVEFKQPVKVNDVISCYGSLVSIGETSIKVHVEVEADRRGQIIPVTSCDLVFVAVDEHGQPANVACATKKSCTTGGA
jgi:acyl-CoA thioesterase YciA